MNTRNMFLLLVAMGVLTTQCSARSLVDTNDDVAVREEDLQRFYDNLMKYLSLGPTAISGKEVPVFDSSISPANAPEPTPVPEPSHKHKHHHKHEDHHHKHEHEDHHHKHDHEENEHHHHKHEHKDHHHKHNPHHEPKALPPTTPISSPAQSPESFMTWMW